TPSEEQQAIREAVSRTVADVGGAYWLARDEDGRVPDEFCNVLAQGGWFGMTMREECGGAGKGITEAAIVMNVIGALGAAATSSVHINLFGPQPVVVFGTPEQKARMLPPLIRGEHRACFGVTEPDAGTNTPNITTFAERRGDRYIVHGKKVWTSTAQR